MKHIHSVEVRGRKLLIYLPPSYSGNPDRRYPVAYVQDGGELFELVSNQLDHLAFKRKIREMIFVGVEPRNRHEEYTPWPAPALIEGGPSFGGKGQEYVDELADQIKPFIDERYRTMPDPEHTAILGGSFGGLIALFAGYWRPDRFGLLGLLSASFWYEGVLPFLREHPLPESVGRVYLSVGDCEGIYKTSIQKTMVPCTIEASNLLARDLPPERLRFELREGGTHDALYMAERFLQAIAFLFPVDAGGKDQHKDMAKHYVAAGRMQSALSAPPAGYAVPGTQVFDVRSEITRRSYRIMVSVPNSPPPKQGFGVLYSLDGNATFGTLAETMRLQGRKPHGYEPMVIVGIGYDSDEPIVTEPRFLDYTIPAEPSELPPRPGGLSWPAVGGAEEFADFIERELKPKVEELAPVDRRRQALFGHSLGGFFALHVLFSRPETFQSYIAGSPSIWWKEHDLMKRWPALEERMRRREIKASLLIGIGSEEKPSMIADAEQLYERMRPYAGETLRLKYRKFEQEGHISVLPPLISELMRFIGVKSEGNP